jgi:hypothetical protein
MHNCADRGIEEDEGVEDGEKKFKKNKIKGQGEERR